MTLSQAPVKRRIGHLPEGIQERLRNRIVEVLRRGPHSDGTEQVVPVVPGDPVPGGRLDRATDQLVLPEGCNQRIPVPRSRERRTTSMPGAAALA
ncbi:hypothetical protein VB716_05015 [Synechococcus sp. CCY9201]|uniref:hypothetical protein n=1 Tax=unclassified Synechococcus TaxID=2626047 RepID=UPI001E451911|nr:MULTISPECIES: hypothetical protein [unclassified Synechococcus]MEA5473578.1 hypothetical protein [Synechococcus sp. CCY9201]